MEASDKGRQILRLRGQKESDEKNAEMPILDRHPNNASEFWRLFCLYLDFVCTRPDCRFHPCTRLLFSIYQGYQGTIEGKALALGIAVEGLVKTLFPPPKAKVAEAKKFVTGIREHCENYIGFQTADVKTRYWNRLSGLLNVLCDESPKDIMHRLASVKAIDQRLIKPWNDLRNRTAHANIWGTKSTQELVDECHAASVLANQLIFKAIGYEGLYTDYTRNLRTAYYCGRPPTEDEIKVAAYFRWQKDGEKSGDDWKHWFEGKQWLEEGGF